jgi:hypothetical protein
MAFADRAAKAVADRYARALFAMALDEARRTLGLPSYPRPTPDEISKAYKAKALAAHPDRGGSEEQMKLVNIARDTLLRQGVAGSPFDWRPEPSPSDPPAPRREKTPVYKQEPGTSFQEAKTAAGVPATATWKFLSDAQWVRNQSVDPSLGEAYVRGFRYWVLYGQTDTKHVFVLLFRTNPRIDHEAQTEYGPSWTMSVGTLPLGSDVLKAIPKGIKAVLSAGSPGGTLKAPLKYILWPEGQDLVDRFVDRLNRGSLVSLKDVLVGAGLVGTQDDGVKGRKTQVEIWGEYDNQRVTRLRAERKAVYAWMAYALFVSVNGKKYKLEDETIDALEKNGFLMHVLSWELGKRKNLSKLRGGRFGATAGYALRKLADGLTGEPSSLVIALTRAAEEWEEEEGEPKTASRLASRFLSTGAIP